MQTDRDSKDASVSKKKNVGKEGHAHLPNPVSYTHLTLPTN